MDNRNIENIIKEAEQGDAEAQCELGNMYYEGKEVEQDYTKARYWYEKAAEQGNAEAAEQGNAEAAEQGNAEAQYSLGILYYVGIGVEQNYKEAAKWAEKAAEQEYAPAQNLLGYLYQHGLGVEQNYQEAIKLYEKAAEQGYASAQYNLGFLYERGLGVEQNYQEAKKLFEKAAEQEHAEAQYNLGYLYQHGLGVEQNYQEAIKLYEKAAEQGYAEAQEELIFLYLCQEDYDIVEKLSRKYYNNGCKRLKYYVDIFDKFKKHNVKKIKSIAEYIGKDIEEDIDAIFIKPENNLYMHAHTLYDIEAFKKIKKKTKKVLEDIPIVKEDKSNELEVFSQICKKMANLIPFDYSFIDNEEKLYTERNLIGALLEGKCVCAGYAELLRNLCLCRNIECIYVASFTHAFNQVKIGGCWYYFDLTYWIQRGGNIEDYLLSEEEFKSISEAKKPLKSQITYESPYNFNDRKRATMKQLVNAYGRNVSSTAIEEAAKALGNQRESLETENKC